MCCEEEGEPAEDDEVSAEGAGWVVEEGVEEAVVEAAEATAVAAEAAADVDVSILLLCVMKRRRSFMAGRRVMMIFST